MSLIAISATDPTLVIIEFHKTEPPWKVECCMNQVLKRSITSESNARRESLPALRVF